MAFAEERDDLVRKLEAERSALVASLSGLDEAAAAQPAPGDEWSVKQQLAHVATAERLYLACVRRAIAEDGTDTADLWPGEQLPTHFAEAREQPLADLIAGMQATRDETIALARGLTEADWNRRGCNTPFGDLTVAQFLKSLYRHDRMHVDQIGGREPSFKPQLNDPGRLRI